MDCDPVEKRIFDFLESVRVFPVNVQLFIADKKDSCEEMETPAPETPLRIKQSKSSNEC